MQTSPAAFFRFAADHTALLLDLFHAREGFTEGELYERIRQHRAGTEPTTEFVFSRLRELGFIELAPDASTRFELTRPVETILRHLLREQHLSSAAVVQGYITDLQQFSDEFEQAFQRMNRSKAIRVLNDLATQVERIRYESRANRDSITSTVMRVRANIERRRPRERKRQRQHSTRMLVCLPLAPTGIAAQNSKMSMRNTEPRATSSRVSGPPQRRGGYRRWPYRFWCLGPGPRLGQRASASLRGLQWGTRRPARPRGRCRLRP